MRKDSDYSIIYLPSGEISFVDLNNLNSVIGLIVKPVKH